MKKRQTISKKKTLKKPFKRGKSLLRKSICKKEYEKVTSSQHDIIMKHEEVAMQIVPLGDRILVKPLEAEEKTKGGIILPDTAKEKPQEGKVVAVGKGKVLEDGRVQPLEVKPQDTILYGNIQAQK